MRKATKVLLIGTTLLVLVIGSLFQIKAERYLSESRSSDGVFRTGRISYLPYLVFELNYKLTGKYQEYFKYARLPYRLEGKYEKYMFHINYGRYFIYCHYSLEELKKMEEELKRHN